jgi:hypothetical protein
MLTGYGWGYQVELASSHEGLKAIGISLEEVFEVFVWPLHGTEKDGLRLGLPVGNL